MRRILSLICIILPALFVSCGGGAKSSGDTLSVAVLRGPSAVQMIHFIDSVSALKTPSVRFEIYDEPLLLRRQLISGEADFAVLPMSMAALVRNSGLDYRLAAVPLWGSLYLCGTDSDITSVSDLRGRSVSMMAKGLTPDIILRHLLTRSGLSPDADLTLDYRFPTHIDLANAAIAGLTGLCVLSEPYVSQVCAKRDDFLPLVNLASEWTAIEGIPLAETAFLCKGGTPDTLVSAVTAAYAASSLWVSEHPDSAAVLACKYGINPDENAVAASVPRSGFKVVKASDAGEDVYSYLKVLLSANPDAIGGKLPDEEFIVR